MLALDPFQPMRFAVQVLGDAHPKSAVIVATLRDLLVPLVAWNAARDLLGNIQRGKLRLADAWHLSVLLTVAECNLTSRSLAAVRSAS